MLTTGSRRRWRLMLALALAGATLLAPPAARAQDEESEAETALVPAGTTHEGNLYAFAERVRIDGVVTGDLISAAESVEIGPDGHVRGDVLAAAYAITVDGRVGGDLRGAAYILRLEASGRVGGEVAAAAYSVELQPGAQVASDVLSAAYQLIVDGTVANDLRFGGAALVINGQVGGDVDAYVASGEARAQRPFSLPMVTDPDLPKPENASPGLSLGDAAVIEGALSYTSTAEATLPTGAQVGGVSYHEVDVEPAQASAPPKSSPWWLTALRIFVALLVVGLLLLALGPRLMRPAVAALRARPLPAIGYGVVAAVADLAALVALAIAFALVLALVLVLTLGGQLAGPAVALFLVLGCLLTFGFLLLMYLGTLISAQCLGETLLRVGAESGPGRRVASLVLGAAILAPLLALPFGLGGLVGLIAGLFGLGALLLIWLGRRRAPAAQELALATPLPGSA